MKSSPTINSVKYAVIRIFLAVCVKLLPGEFQISPHFAFHRVNN
ncbi:hypothetical protein SODG_004208 [Sodalis praecaptivus]